jgi:hypothetical protein
MSQSDSPTLDELPTATREAIQALGDLGQGLDRIKELDDEEFHELVSLMETLGMEDEAESLRSTRRDLLKTAGAGAAALGVGATGGLAASGTASADPKSTQDGTIGDGTEDWDVQDIDANHVASNSVSTEDLSTEDLPVVDVTANGAVGDGSTDDTAAVSDALAVAEARQGTLYFPATGAASGSGITDRDTEYLVDFTNTNAAGIYVSTDGVTVAGESRGSTAVVASATDQNGGAIKGEGADNGRVRDLALDARVSAKTGFGNLTLANADGWKVERVDMLRNGQNALQLGVGGGNTKPVTNSTFVDCYAGRCANDGFLGAVSLFDGSDGNQFVRVEITESPLNSIGHAGFGVEYGSDNEFIECHVHDLGPHAGFRMEGDDASGDNKRNRIVGGRWHGLQSAIKDAGATGGADHNVADGLLVFDTDGPGLDFNATNWTVKNCVIDGRMPGGIGSDGILTRAQATGLTLRNVDVYGVTGAQKYGMRLNSPDVEVMGCYVDTVDRVGIYITESGAAVGNHVVDPGQDTSAADFNRCALEADGPSGDVDLVDNVERGAPAGNGIVLSGTHSGDTRVTQNDVPDGIANSGKATTVSNNST